MDRKIAEEWVNRFAQLVELTTETRIAHHVGLRAILPDREQEALREQEHLRTRLIVALTEKE